MPARRRQGRPPAPSEVAPSLTLQATGRSPHDDADMLNAASLFGFQREITRTAMGLALVAVAVSLLR